MAYRENLAPDPATHVLVIGVDAYTHLPPEGGGGPPVRGHDYAPGLTKISTATPSVEKLANWFLGSFDHPNRPLGSLDVLLSSGSFVREGQAAQAVAKPIFKEIRKAFFEWKSRCDSHDDNHAILYFCGHGMEESSHYLLPEDVFDDPAALDENFIDLDGTIKFMGQCRASTQLYFIDACRSPFPHKLEAIRTNLVNLHKDFGRTLIAPQANGAFFPRHAVLYKSAPKKGAPAKARAGQETYFAEALIECLKHYGADDDAGSGEYWVRIESLRDALQERMRRQSVKYTMPDLGFGYRMEEMDLRKKPDLHLMPAASARVQSQVLLKPKTAHDAATINLVGSQNYQRPPSTETWEDEVLPGEYEVTMSFTNPALVKKPFRAYFTMPIYSPKWPVP